MANRFYLMAIEKGKDSDAMWRYGQNLEAGRGIDANPVAANEYFKMAAEQDHVPAMVKYARNLANGFGFDVRDLRLAREYAERALARAEDDDDVDDASDVLRLIEVEEASALQF